MKKWLIIGGAVVVILVGAILVLKKPSAPTPEKAAATAEDQAGTEGSSDAAAPGETQADAEAPAASGPPAGETVVYQIQACVDEKATLALVGDKLEWSNLTGGGLNADTCAPEFRGKTTIQVTHNGEGGEVHTYNTTAGGQVGPLPFAMPAKDPMAPATVEFSTEARQGSVTVTSQPMSPWWRVQLQFDDPDGFAHQYTARLTLTYK